MSRAPGCSLVVVSVHDALEFLAGLTVEIIGQVVEALYEPFPERHCARDSSGGEGPAAGASDVSVGEAAPADQEGALGLGLGLLLGLELAGERRPTVVLPIMGWWSGWKLELSVVVARHWRPPTPAWLPSCNNNNNNNLFL